tara:strand:+ start:3166 stop:3441 length:276 start_codon:yes stop_codon:yes gene_type:complete
LAAQVFSLFCHQSLLSAGVAVVYLDKLQPAVALAAVLKELEVLQAVGREPLTKDTPVGIGLQVDLLAQVVVVLVLLVQPNQPQMLVQAAMV